MMSHVAVLVMCPYRQMDVDCNSLQLYMCSAVCIRTAYEMLLLYFLFLFSFECTRLTTVYRPYILCTCLSVCAFSALTLQAGFEFDVCSL